jgi:hypothetical protein
MLLLAAANWQKITECFVWHILPCGTSSLYKVLEE